MEILFNELSLTGQFIDKEMFIKNELSFLIGVLKEMQEFSTLLLLKKSDIWENKINSSMTLHEFITHSDFHKSDEVRKFKSAIIGLTIGPFWDFDSRQPPDSTYFLDKTCIWGSSPAEACERGQVVVSFASSLASTNPLNVIRNGQDHPLSNLIHSSDLIEFLWLNNKISFETYLKKTFSRGKLDFSRVDSSMGFSTILPPEQSIFIDCFRKFEELSWEQIYVDRGLNYKEFHDCIGSEYRDMKTHKFRVSQKFRCHGYRINNSFVIIGFETDHKLSDRG